MTRHTELPGRGPAPCISARCPRCATEAAQTKAGPRLPSGLLQTVLFLSSGEEEPAPASIHTPGPTFWGDPCQWGATAAAPSAESYSGPDGPDEAATPNPHCSRQGRYHLAQGTFQKVCLDVGALTTPRGDWGEQHTHTSLLSVSPTVTPTSGPGQGNTRPGGDKMVSLFQ